MTNLAGHARRELELIGEDPKYVDSIVRAIEAFADYGHSGGSAEIAVEQLTRLLRFENLAPITDNPADWEDRSGISGYPVWQNRRNPKLMSENCGKTYWDVNDPYKRPHTPQSFDRHCPQTALHAAHDWDGRNDETSGRLYHCNGMLPVSSHD